MSEKEKLYSLLKDIFLLLDDGDRQFFEQYNLTSRRFYSLFHIGNEPGISFSNLSTRLLCDKSNVTRIIKGLEADDLVQKKPHETDGRSLRLFLTDKGTAVRDQAAAAHKIFNETRFNCFTEIQQGSLLDNLTKLNDHLNHELPQLNGRDAANQTPQKS